MKRYIRAILFVFLCFSIFRAIGVSADETRPKQSLIFGVYTSDKPSAMVKKFWPLIDYLNRSLEAQNFSAELTIKVYPSYTGAVDAIVEGQCDVVRFGPASYITAKDRNPNIRLLAMEHKKRQTKSKGIFIVPGDSSLTSIAQITGKSFAFGDENSTIGRYLSQEALVKAGVFASDLSGYTYLGRHDKVALAVANGNYDAGVVKENTFNKYTESHGLKKIGEFFNITKPWIVREGLGDDIFQALQTALMDCREEKVLKVLKQDGFLIATDKDYDFIRDAMKASEQFFNGSGQTLSD